MIASSESVPVRISYFPQLRDKKKIGEEKDEDTRSRHLTHQRDHPDPHRDRNVVTQVHRKPTAPDQRKRNGQSTIPVFIADFCFFIVKQKTDKKA